MTWWNKGPVALAESRCLCESKNLWASGYWVLFDCENSTLFPRLEGIHYETETERGSVAGPFEGRDGAWREEVENKQPPDSVIYV